MNCLMATADRSAHLKIDGQSMVVARLAEKMQPRSIARQGIWLGISQKTSSHLIWRTSVLCNLLTASDMSIPCR